MRRVGICVVCMAFLASLSSVAQELPKWAALPVPAHDPGSVTLETRPQQYLFGDWGGMRTALAEKAFPLTFSTLPIYRRIRLVDKNKQKPGGREFAEP